MGWIYISEMEVWSLEGYTFLSTGISHISLFPAHQSQTQSFKLDVSQDLPGTSLKSYFGLCQCYLWRINGLLMVCLPTNTVLNACGPSNVGSQRQEISCTSFFSRLWVSWLWSWSSGDEMKKIILDVHFKTARRKCSPVFLLWKLFFFFFNVSLWCQACINRYTSGNSCECRIQHPIRWWNYRSFVISVWDDVAVCLHRVLIFLFLL